MSVEKRIIELREQNIGMRAIAKCLEVNIDTVKYYCKKHNLTGVRAYCGGIEKAESDIEKQLDIKHSKFEYIGGYTGADGYMYVMCKDCGDLRKRSTQILRPNRIKKLYNCQKCASIFKKQKEEKEKLERILREKIKEEERISRKKQREEELQAKTHQKECIVCGTLFLTTKSTKKCCSSGCSKKRANKNKDKRIYKNGIPDLSITLDKLIYRDKCVCHICGEKCDVEDYSYDDAGYFIAGEKYPSIDHVVPISKGGIHSWDNVKLAHFYCNTIKSDNER